MKEERLQLRVDPKAKRRLEDAARAAHLNLSSFVLQAAQQRADDVLAERTLIDLDEAGAISFLEALGRPAVVNDQLLEAIQRPVKVDWLD